MAYKVGDEVSITITGFIVGVGGFEGFELETDGGELIDVVENDWTIEVLS